MEDERYVKQILKWKTKRKGI